MECRKGGELSSAPQQRIIDIDMSGTWYEESIDMRSTNTVENIVRYCHPFIEYCQRFDLEMLATVSNDGRKWTFVPVQRTGSLAPEHSARLKELIEGAAEVVIFDSGNESYNDTQQLGIEDGWFRHGQTHYDVDPDSILVSVVERARNTLRFVHVDTFNSDGSKGTPYGYSDDFTGEPIEITRV